MPFLREMGRMKCFTLKVSQLELFIDFLIFPVSNVSQMGIQKN